MSKKGENSRGYAIILGDGDLLNFIDMQYIGRIQRNKIKIKTEAN